MDAGELFLPLGIRYPLQHIGGFVAESTRPNKLVNLRMDHNQVRRRAVLFFRSADVGSDVRHEKKHHVPFHWQTARNPTVSVW